jgi:demethoxyubiquinone hydroxylase (CLK1/Coq7/Cat5 family)
MQKAARLLQRTSLKSIRRSAMSENLTKTLNGLLRGELAAVETYDHAIDTFDGEAVPQLRHIKDEHRIFANTLREQVNVMGGRPDETSGAWGAFAKLIEGTASFVGNKVALKALKGGEESGLRSYEKVLKDPELPPNCQNLIETELLPQTRNHIKVLDRLLTTD